MINIILIIAMVFGVHPAMVDAPPALISVPSALLGEPTAIVAVPPALLGISAFQVFIFYPWQHLRNVERMDAKNDLVWEEGIARVVTVETELRTMNSTENLTTTVVCYEGNFARPWSLKSGQYTGISPESIGFEGLQAEFPTGATLEIDMWRLCKQALLMDTNELPMKVEGNSAKIIVPELSLYCRFSNMNPSVLFHTDAGRVGYPYIIAFEDRPLHSLATRADMGSSERPSSSRWNGMDLRSSNWRETEQCWGGRGGLCSEAMTNYCGKNPR